MKINFYTALKSLAILSFLVPLVVFPSLFIFPFAVSKVIFFRSVVLLMLIPWVFLLVSQYKKYRPSWHLLHIAVGIYFVSLLLSTFLAVDFHLSFWHTHEKMLGLFTLVHYGLYYLILSTVFTDPKEWKQFQWYFLLAGVVMVLVGLYQKIRPDYLLNNNEWRVISTLGNPISVAGFGLFMSYTGYLLGIQEQVPWKKYGAWGAAFLGVGAIFMSGTRGTALALVVSLMLMLLLYFFLLKNQIKIRSIIGVFFLSLTVGGVGLFAFRESTWVEQSSSLSRLVNISLAESGVGARFIVWGLSIDAWKGHPFLGWGLNNYYHAFNKYYDPVLLSVSASETWFDNAHNVVVNTLVTQGVFGVMSYSAIFITALFVLLRSYKKGQIDIHIFVTGTAFLVGHFIHNLFIFENPTSYLYFFFFLAFVVVSTQPKNDLETKEEKKNIPAWLKAGLPLAVIAAVYITNINVARANHLTLEARRLLFEGKIAQSLPLYEQAKLLKSPYSADLSMSFISPALRLVENTYRQGKKSQDLVTFTDFLYREQNSLHQQKPLDIRVHITQAQIEMMKFYLQSDPQFLAEAESLLQDARKISPKRQEINFIWALVKTLQKRPEEAIALYREAIEWEPRAGEAWIKLALAYYTDLGQAQKTLETFQEAESREVLFTPYHLQVIKEFRNLAPSL